MKKKNKITLFIMSQKGFAVLQYVNENYRELIDCVVTTADNNVINDYYEEIKNYCRINNISCIDRKEKHSIDTEYSFAISWRWLLPLSNKKLIVFHDSLLPKYRGFNPLVSMLINGEKKIGVSALFAAEKYDRGDIIGQADLEIEYPIKIATAIEKISEKYQELSGSILKLIKANKEISVKKQNEDVATYSLWRDDEDYQINWNENAEFIKRFIDAVGFPYRGASSSIKNAIVRIFDAEEIADVIVENRTPGKVIFIEEGFPIIVCGHGLLKITSMTDDSGKNLLPYNNMRSRFK